ncbi:hypothetical protein AB0M20_29230 [Actinoplanes sp. NPDC051633]|uniref:hypothetical protein n=1 Tax=Actinoplanes sp. NPDC051633 TaxID=3155670 RepID=UPI0034148D05
MSAAGEYAAGPDMIQSSGAGSHMTTSTRGKNETTGVARNRSHGEETKPSFKTTELVVYVVVVVGVLIASYVVGDRANNDGTDIFAADKAWWYITLLTIGYMISRGLAKAGSRSSDSDPRTDSYDH